jgi:hypothetical protein
MQAKYSTKSFLNRKASLSDNPHNLEMFHEEVLSEDTMSSSNDCILEDSISIFRKDEILSICVEMQIYTMVNYFVSLMIHT